MHFVLTHQAILRKGWYRNYINLGFSRKDGGETYSFWNLTWEKVGVTPGSICNLLVGDRVELEKKQN